MYISPHDIASPHKCVKSKKYKLQAIISTKDKNGEINKTSSRRCIKCEAAHAHVFG